MDVGRGVFNGVADAGLSGEVKDVGEMNDGEEFGEEAVVVEIAVDEEDRAAG